MNEATVLEDARRDTRDASDSADVIDMCAGSWPTREYFHVVYAFACALFLWKVVKSDAAPRIIGIY